jgi:hypothetical protein
MGADSLVYELGTIGLLLIPKSIAFLNQFNYAV